MKITKRTNSFILVLLIYLLAFLAAIITYVFFSEKHILFSTFLADIAATLVVWIFGIILDNSSVYDPYWSVAPIFIIVFWLFSLEANFTTVVILLLAAIFIWGIRLTLNWAMRWKGLKSQDWRYTMLKENNPKMWFITNLVGINLMPTFIVYVAIIPAYYTLTADGNINGITLLGFMVCTFAISIQAISDRQMDLFKRKKPAKSKCINEGLWKYCRHPNYLGEVSFWWGIWIIQIGVAPRIWITAVGPIVVTLLFVFISIPLMEKHILEKNPSYNSYCKEVPMIIPWFRANKAS